MGRGFQEQRLARDSQGQGGLSSEVEMGEALVLEDFAPCCHGAYLSLP
jgi:hypothetical protein